VLDDVLVTAFLNLAKSHHSLAMINISAGWAEFWIKLLETLRLMHSDDLKILFQITTNTTVTE